MSSPPTASATDYDFLVRVSIVGEARIGKSNVLTKYAHDTTTTEYLSTIGVDFAIRQIDYEYTPKGKTESEACIVKIQIWDTAGDRRFRTITSAYLRNCSIILAYDITNKESFD